MESHYSSIRQWCVGTDCTEAYRFWLSIVYTCNDGLAVASTKQTLRRSVVITPRHHVPAASSGASRSGVRMVWFAQSGCSGSQPNGQGVWRRLGERPAAKRGEAYLNQIVR